MKNKINIAKLLKDCPRDMELDCTMYENVYFDYVDSIGGINCYIKSNDGCLTRVRFLENGCYTTMSNAKCVIFPKGKTTWEGFTPPCNFKEGDVIISDYGNIHLLRTEDSSYCSYRRICKNKLDVTVTTSITVVRFATEEEKQELFDAIKANGYKWNEETKTLEELPKFTDGDIVFYNDTIAIFKEWGDETLFRTYCVLYTTVGMFEISRPLFGKGIRKEVRFATEKEKAKLFDAIKSNGYKWNEATKKLEKLIELKFKVGG